jgi:hypothetical protein
MCAYDDCRILSRSKTGYSGSSTIRRKCTRPDSSPATIVRPSRAIAQLYMPFSPVKVASSSPLCKVPEPQRSVSGARHAAAPVGCYRHDPDLTGMPFERADRLAVLQVPEPQRSIGRARHGPEPIGRHRRGADPVRMAGLAQQRYVKSHRNLLRSPRSEPRPGGPYRPTRVTGVGRPPGSPCFFRCRCNVLTAILRLRQNSFRGIPLASNSITSRWTSSRLRRFRVSTSWFSSMWKIHHKNLTHTKCG